MINLTVYIVLSSSLRFLKLLLTPNSIAFPNQYSEIIVSNKKQCYDCGGGGGGWGVCLVGRGNVPFVPLPPAVNLTVTCAHALCMYGIEFKAFLVYAVTDGTAITRSETVYYAV